jgi:hypothetical protein
MTIDVDEIRAMYRETVAATAQGGSGEDFATLAAYLPALCDEVEAERVRARVLRDALMELRGHEKGAMQSYFQGDVGDCFDAWGNVSRVVEAALAAVGDA